MANYTSNYNLKKPLQTEYYNVDDFNENADIIDGALNGNVARIEANENDISDIKNVLKSAAKCVTVAAYDSEERYKKYADLTCTGTNDEEIISTAIEMISGGIVLLCPGNFNMKSLAIMKNDISICGYGNSTVLNFTSTDSAGIGIMLYGDDIALRNMKIVHDSSSTDQYSSAVYFNGINDMSSKRSLFEGVNITSNVLCFCDHILAHTSTGGEYTRFVGVVCESGKTSGFDLVHTAAFGAVFDNGTVK